MPLHVSSTCAHHQEVKIALHSLWYHHTYRCDDITRDILYISVHITRDTLYISVHITRDTLYISVHITRDTLYISVHITRDILYISVHITRDTLYISAHITRDTLYILYSVQYHNIACFKTNPGRILWMSRDCGFTLFRVRTEDTGDKVQNMFTAVLSSWTAYCIAFWHFILGFFRLF